MKNDIEIKIQETLDEMQQMFKVAIGPKNRREYMNSIGVSGRDWHFSLTPEQIIKNKIPATSPNGLFFYIKLLDNSRFSVILPL